MIIPIFIFLFGLLIGSFLNVCIYRIPKKESIVFPSSHCPKCDHPLEFYDLVPVLSYIFQRGRCRYCGDAISPRYALVELLNALMYLVVFYFYGFTLDFIFYAIITSILIVITFVDLDIMEIPDIFVVSLLLVSVLHKALNCFIYNIEFGFLDSLLGFLVSGILFLLIITVSKGGMGGGDMTLIAALGFILGLKKIAVTILLSFLYGSIISIFLLASKLKTRKDPIPFGPFIVLGFFTSLFWGDGIILWYIDRFINY